MRTLSASWPGSRAISARSQTPTWISPRSASEAASRRSYAGSTSTSTGAARRFSPHTSAEPQVVKYKEKVTHRKKPLSAVRVPPQDGEEEEARSPEPERIRLRVRPMTVSEAVAELEADGQAFYVYQDEDSGAIQIVARRADGTVAVIEPILT